MKRVGVRNQEVTDAQGRRRFHGAFTGGFSAGYYNSVGSERGWTPKTFSSSRKNRSSRVEQRPEDFMDEEDDPLLGKRLETSECYDTVQTDSKRRLKQQQQQPESSQAAAIPVFTLPDDWILPVHDSIGVNLLKQMGWKEGHGIGKRIRRHKFQEEEEEKERGGHVMHDADADKTHMQLQEEAEEEVSVLSRKVFDVQKVFLKPKLDRHGIGFDPYTDAPEFSVYKQQQQEKEKEGSHRHGVSFVDALNSSNGSNRVTSGYGLSALEENDDVDVYGTVSMAEFDRVIAPLGAKNNIRRITSSAQRFRRHEKTRRSRALCSDGISVLPGFELAVSIEKSPKVINTRLAVPSGYTAYHRFDEDEDYDDAVTALYRKFNFSTDATNNGTFVTAKQRSVFFEDNRKNGQGDTDNVRADASEVARPLKSAFGFRGKSQKAQHVDAVKQAKQGLPVLCSMPTASVDEPAPPKGRQPLVCANSGDQFRASISASIAKRFVSSKSSMVEGKKDSSQPDVSQAKVSRRSQNLWIPKSMLCKRFHVKCTGPTGSNGKDNTGDKKRDLFDDELVPHLMEYAADRAAHKQSEVDMNKTSKYSEFVETERVESRDLPVLPAAEKGCASLLKAIFEPSDESDLSRDSSADESEDDDNDEEREVLGVSKQESLSKLTFRVHPASCSSGDAGESLPVAAEGYREKSSSSDDETFIPTASAASGRVSEQMNRRRKRSHSVGTGDDGDAKRKAKGHKKHKKHHKHRLSRDSKDKKKDKKEQKSHKCRSSKHFRRC
ncbi:unnamed protein product [Peronospora destructor]|uniref:G-patch domain-containing protein n=1 Tax=Peronospora destructor TaxID=86335 RepID=A0AAV0U5G1_9STRA|nr:unnamed protein product [Peronospora destructor]